MSNQSESEKITGSTLTPPTGIPPSINAATIINYSGGQINFGINYGDNKQGCKEECKPMLPQETNSIQSAQKTLSEKEIKTESTKDGRIRLCGFPNRRFVLIVIFLVVVIIILGSLTIYFSTKQNKNDSENLNKSILTNYTTRATTATTEFLKTTKIPATAITVDNLSPNQESKSQNQNNLPSLIIPLYVNTPSILTHSLSNLLPNTKIQLTINATKKYNWLGNSRFENPTSIITLILIGVFDMETINYFLSSFSSLKTLEISEGRLLCDQFLGVYNYSTINDGPRSYFKVKSLALSSIYLPYENLYRWLIDIFAFSQIIELKLHNVSIHFENYNYFHQFIDVHQEHFVKMNFQNVFLCSIPNCTLFDKVYFPVMKDATLNFAYVDMPTSKKSLKNFNRATPNIEKFSSNVQCEKKEWIQYLKHWKLVQNNAQNICQGHHLNLVE